jgi:hypothetical protein
MIQVRELEPGGEPAWKRFVEESNNGTLFHDLDFLSYHPPEKFCTRHLVFSEAGETIAVMPAAVEDGVLKSPYGASVGGVVLPLSYSASKTREIVAELRHFALNYGLSAIELRVGPPAYLRNPDEHLGFALFAENFRLIRRHLCHIVPLPAVLKKPKLRDSRMGLRRGLQPLEAGPERIPEFYRILMETNARHGATPTHTEAQLADLFQRVPGRVRLFLCECAGILVFVLNARVAYTFYIASGDAPYAATTLLAHVAEQLANEGFAFLDLGPSTFDDLRFNDGLAAFKEGFGARGQCRDTWRWG